MFKEKYGKGIIEMHFILKNCVNDDKEVDTTNLQVMRCLLCYNNLMHTVNLNTKEIKWLITYYKTCGCRSCYNCLEAIHDQIRTFERQPTNK